MTEKPKLTPEQQKSVEQIRAMMRKSGPEKPVKKMSRKTKAIIGVSCFLLVVVGFLIWIYPPPYYYHEKLTGLVQDFQTDANGKVTQVTIIYYPQVDNRGYAYGTGKVWTFPYTDGKASVLEDWKSYKEMVTVEYSGSISRVIIHSITGPSV